MSRKRRPREATLPHCVLDRGGLTALSADRSVRASGCAGSSIDRARSPSHPVAPKELDFVVGTSTMAQMSTAESLAPTSPQPLRWAKICELHPNEWVCLLDVESAPDGSIRAARVVGHDRSMRHALAQIGPPQQGAMVVHTWRRPLQSPRIEMTDEIRDIIRPRR